jgi:hypothetical protein
MSLTDDSMVMPVSPIYNNGGGSGFGGGDWGSWIILFLLFGMFNNGWNNGGANGMNAGIPWMMSQNTDNLIASGFANQGVNSALNGIQNAITSGFGDVKNSLCGGFAGVNASVNGAQNALAQQLYTNQISDLERSFAAQTATTQGMNAIAMNQQNCCCENRAATADLKYTVATEACADRNAISQALANVTAQNNANTQRILDQLCADKIEQKNDVINQLRSELMYARGQASQDVQTSAIQAGQRALANEVEQYVAPRPVPAYYVQNPNGCNCGNYSGCGCGM